jgi:hypothetical protein
MLASPSESLTTDSELAFMLQGAMVGVSRSLLESGAPEERFAAQSADYRSLPGLQLDL